MAAKAGRSCTLLSALPAEKRPKYRSSPVATGQFTAASASGNDEAGVSKSPVWRLGPAGVPYPDSELAIGDGTVARLIDPRRTPQPIAYIRVPALARTEASWTASSLSTFVGRGDQLAELGTLIRQPDARAVTLTGPGGVGKTRLAVEVARRNKDAFPGGVGFIALAAVRDTTLVLPTVAATIGSRRSDVPALQIITDVLGGARVLLVLDNMEQVIEAGAEVSDLLQSCPGLTVLVTSRERLAIAEERTYPVPPLGLRIAPAGVDSGHALCR